MVGGTTSTTALGGVRSSTQHAELVALRISENDPGLISLADVSALSTQSQEPCDLLVPVATNGTEIEMKAVLDRLLFRDSYEDEGHVWKGVT
jgi:hypothetical protein